MRVGLGAAHDPADVLRAVAAAYGDLTVEAATGNYGGTLDDLDADETDAAAHFLADPERAAIDAHVAAHHARRAWRFALAAVALDARADPAIHPGLPGT